MEERYIPGYGPPPYTRRCSPSARTHRWSPCTADVTVVYTGPGCLSDTFEASGVKARLLPDGKCVLFPHYRSLDPEKFVDPGLK